VILVWAGAALWAYAYAGYPLVLMAAARRRRREPALRPQERDQVPLVSVSLPVHNEAAAIRETLERILASEYPADRLQVVVVSDASTDGTDEIVREYAGRGVELLRLPERRGKTAAENAARERLRGDVVINTDASVRVHPAAIRHLVAALRDPRVGVASSRDVSFGNTSATATSGEGTYVGYEMWVRDLETRVGGIVGASGCLYAIRPELHRLSIPDELSRDFASALNARLYGYTAVSVAEAICFVPRGTRLRQEYRRKVRTMARGLRTLWRFRVLLDPAGDGAFAWKLWSHKLVRWLLPWASVLMLLGLLQVAFGAGWGIFALAGLVAALASCFAVALWPSASSPPRALSAFAFFVASVMAGLHAWWTAATAPSLARWEPTRRDGVPITSRAAPRS
jgi:cellulose synthase/poly-beta-1,6-N-acetylglucosamine synthase-like glycosyltransferase